MYNNKKTIFITGGGTGGHIYPAVAIYNELNKEDFNLFYIGNKKKLEYEICMRERFNFLSVDVDAMPRKLNFEFVFWCLKTFVASIVAIFYFFRYKPDAVFATGGYVSSPALIAAFFLKVPYMLHDCDAHPGIVSRYFSKYAKKVSIAFESAKDFINNPKTCFNGNPIRDDFSNISKEEARNELCIPKNVFVILFMGGSQGAKTINEASKALIKEYSGNDKFFLIIQTGKKHYTNYMKEIGKMQKNVIVKPYFVNMTIPLLASDLVISRAGSLSISEICASSLPSVMVPYPYAAANHQKLNANIMQDMGAALCLSDSDCVEKMQEIVAGLINDREKLKIMSTAARKNAKLSATKNIKNQLLEILSK